MNRLFTLFMLCVAVLPSGGCTKEDLSDCQTDVTLKLSYTLNPQDRDLWSETAEFGEFFLYDGSTGELVQSRPLGSEEVLNQTVRFKVPQAAGSYTAVVWVNHRQEDYTLEGTGTLGGMRLKLRHENGQVGRPYPNWQELGYVLGGMQTFTTDGQRTPVEGTVSHRKNTNVVQVILQGAVSGMRGANPTGYTIQLTGKNGVYNSQNEPLTQESPTLSYTPDHSVKDKDLTAVFHTLHLTDDMRLTIWNGTSKLHDYNVRELIELALKEQGEILSEELLWRNDEWGFKFDANLMLTEVKVLDWIGVEDIGGI